MQKRTYQHSPKPLLSQYSIRHPLRNGALMVFGAVLSAQPAFAQAPSSSNSETLRDAAKSLESVLQDAADQGFLKGKPTARPRDETAKPAAKPDVTAAQNITPKLPVGDCKVAAKINITAFKDVTSFEDVFKAKAKLGNMGTAEADMSTLIMNYLALGLGTEALALSERSDKKVLEALARVVADEASAEDKDIIVSYESCHESFKVWSLASHITLGTQQSDMDRLSQSHFDTLDNFPPLLRERFEINFAIHAAEIGDFLNAERLLTRYASNTKYGEIPESKDDDILYLYALIQQHKEDPRFAEVLTHIATYDGRYKTRAVKVLAEDSETTGRELPPEFENELTAIYDQYGDGQEGRTASLELIKFRLAGNQFSDAIKTAKVKFEKADPQRVETVGLIAEKISSELGSPERTNRLYALNGYFYDIDFFALYPKLGELTLQVHDGTIDLDLPELAERLAQTLEAFSKSEKGLNVENRVLLAKAQLALKGAHYDDVITILEPIKTGKQAATLRKDAALASRNRTLVQKILSEQAASASRTSDYLEFSLKKGNWAEAKTLSQNPVMTQAASASQGFKQKDMKLPLSFSAEALTYLAAPIAASGKDISLGSAAELDGLLSLLKSNANVAKGLLNYAPTEK